MLVSFQAELTVEVQKGDYSPAVLRTGQTRPRTLGPNASAESVRGRVSGLVRGLQAACPVEQLKGEQEILTGREEN